MSTVSAALGSQSAPYTIEHGGKVYKTRPINQKVKAEYEVWLKQEAMRVVLAMREFVSQDDFAALATKVNDQIVSKKYAFHGDFARETMCKEGGALKLTSLVFQCSEEETVALMEAKGDEVNMVMEAVLRESFGDVKSPEPKAGGGDPN